VPERCTCGAILPEEARFCHKCGKPQFEEDAARLDALEAPAAPPLPTAPRVPGTGISFKNSRAVLVTLIVAVGALFGVTALGLTVPPLVPILLCAAGFVAVRLYKGQSAEALSTAAGARLGWMTGLWLFLVVVIVCAISALYVSSPEGWEQVRSAWNQLPKSSKLPDSQHDFFVQILIGLPFSFFLLTLLPGLGGILGAKMSTRRRPS
jgi:hypothetical protein